MKKILIVDNIEENLKIMSTYFAESGYEILTAKTSSAAIRTARFIKPHLIILELNMPEISGYEICKTLKNDNETKDIIILAVTARDSKEAKSHAFYVGADDYMVKPFYGTALMNKVKSLFRVMDLTDELEKQYGAVKEKNMQLELQLKMARQIQQALVTKYNDVINGISFNSKYMPALDIGGDYYEIYKINDSIICVFMADVSGHGISAALLTSMIKIMFKKYITEKLPPNTLLEYMNNEFCSIFSDSDINVYTCAFIAYIDTKNRIITCSNAGHALPLFIDNKTLNIEEIDISGTPLGMIDKMTYNQKIFPYNINDIIEFYTDGLSDSFYKDAPEDFLYHIKEIIKVMKDEPSEDILNTIIEQMYNFDESAKYQNDDVSIILCKLKENGTS